MHCVSRFLREGASAHQRKFGVHLERLSMFVQSGEVSVVDGHVDMLAASACGECLVLVRMILHLAGRIRNGCRGSIHDSDEPAALALRKGRKEREEAVRLSCAVSVGLFSSVRVS